MFKINDKVVYPMHGVGVITSIEDKKFIDEKKEFYTIELVHQNMNIMISSEKIEDSNLRQISTPSTLDDVLSSINDYDESDSSENLIPKERYRVNLEKMKSGKLKEGLELIRDLTHINSEKTLNTNEMKMLTTTRKYIADEIAIVKNITEEQANDLITANLI